MCMRVFNQFNHPSRRRSIQPVQAPVRIWFRPGPGVQGVQHVQVSSQAATCALGKYIDTNKEWALELLRQGKNNSRYKVKKLEQVSRKAKTLYYIEMDNQKRLKRDKKLSQLKGKSAQEKSKMIHSMINRSSGS